VKRAARPAKRRRYGERPVAWLVLVRWLAAEARKLGGKPRGETCPACGEEFTPDEVRWEFVTADGRSSAPEHYHERCGPKREAARRAAARRAARVEADRPDPTMARRFAALGPGGPAALAALWARPRLRPVAWLVLDSVERARTRIARGRAEYARDHAARDRERKTPPPPSEWEPWPSTRVPLDVLRGVLRRGLAPVRVRRAVEGADLPEPPLSFKLGRGERIEADVLADLRARLAALDVPSRGSVNLIERLVGLARSPVVRSSHFSRSTPTVPSNPRVERSAIVRLWASTRRHRRQQ
jgi:hypothetical protein